MFNSHTRWCDSLWVSIFVESPDPYYSVQIFRRLFEQNPCLKKFSFIRRRRSPVFLSFSGSRSLVPFSDVFTPYPPHSSVWKTSNGRNIRKTRNYYSPSINRVMFRWRRGSSFPSFQWTSWRGVCIFHYVINIRYDLTWGSQLPYL